MIDASTGWYCMHCSVKVVVIASSSVLLGLNSRNEWELPGGWPDKEDISLEQTAVREIYEEAGFVIEGKLQLVGADLYSPSPTGKVALITYVTTVEPVPQIRASAEHSRVEFHSVQSLPENLPQIYVDLIDKAWRSKNNTNI